jgi:hypothetical protein
VTGVIDAAGTKTSVSIHAGYLENRKRYWYDNTHFIVKVGDMERTCKASQIEGVFLHIKFSDDITVILSVRTSRKAGYAYEILAKLESTPETDVTVEITYLADGYIKLDANYLPNNNILNGSAIGSIRTNGSSVESADYTIGQYAFAEGNVTIASGFASHAEGQNTTAFGKCSHAEGQNTTAFGNYSHVEGQNAIAFGNYSHAEGQGYKATLFFTGDANATTYTFTSDVVVTSAVNKIIKYNDVYAKITAYSDSTITLDKTLSSEALNSTRVYLISSGLALGDYSHTEGDRTLATGIASHAEGALTEASGDYSHAEGNDTTASGNHSHAEGYETESANFASHAEGMVTTASGQISHAEGYFTTASGQMSHAEGYVTIAASNYQHAQGKYNIEDSSNIYAHIVGNGTSSARSNAHTLDWDGNAWYQGDVYVGSTSGTNKDEGSKKLATEEYVATELANLVGTAPETLDTIEELATAFQENEDVVETLNNAIANKADKTDLETYEFISIADIDAICATDIEAVINNSLEVIENGTY